MKSPLQIHLRSGETLQVQKLGMSGYVAHPMGGLILGGAASGKNVGKFCIGVYYPDGETGLIAQEEISEIRDAKGKRVPYGNPRYPGHPDFDPRDGFDPLRDQIEALQRSVKRREERQALVQEKGLSWVIEEEIKKVNQEFLEKEKKSKKSSKKKKKSKKSSKKKSKKSSKKKGSSKKKKSTKKR